MYMREETTFRVRAFRKALELAKGERSKECRDLGRWKTDLHNFPHGSCDMASNCLAQYLMEKECGHPCIIFMNGSTLENSTVRAHVIVMLNGEYIDLTLDQFDEYADYVLTERMESGGVIGMLLRRIGEVEGPIKTRPIKLSSNNECGNHMYAWLRDTADQIFEEEKGPSHQQETRAFRKKIIISYAGQN
jgi:hypothetical protein